jgi:hypothetical protein
MARLIVCFVCLLFGSHVKHLFATNNNKNQQSATNKEVRIALLSRSSSAWLWTLRLRTAANIWDDGLMSVY